MLKAEEIHKNWEIHQKILNKFFSGERLEKINNLYEDFEEIAVMSPASSKESFHNAFPGGYIDHVNRVVKFSLKVHDLWSTLGMEIDYTVEELVFSALFHDLGKLGTSDNPGYLPQDDNWRKDKLGEIFKVNKSNNFMLIPDRSIFTLQQYGISMSEKEYLTIKIHDGLYDDVNKPYYISYDVESKLKTNLPYIVSHGDFLAYKYEFERWKAAKK